MPEYKVDNRESKKSAAKRKRGRPVKAAGKSKAGFRRFVYGHGKKSAALLMAVMALYFGYIISLERQFYREAAVEAEPSVSSQNFAAGSYVKFGRYRQTRELALDPIEWLVLENNGETALLISKFALDCYNFHYAITPVSWRDCDLRKWLNGDFLQSAFNFEEIGRIADSKIYTGANLECNTEGCGETTDKVFCLSIDEAKQYFSSDDARKCQPTEFAIARHAYYNRDNGCGSFWLRSQGYMLDKAACVLYNGAVDSSGHDPNVLGSSVRPALRINL